MQSIYRLWLAAMLLVAVPAQAQRILLGLKGGATIANGIGADAKNSSLRFGAHGGGLLRIKLTKHLAVQGEALYTQRGDNSSAYGPSIQHRLDYVSFPVLAQYHWDDIFFEAGPYFSQLRSVTPVVAQRTPVGTAAFRKQDAGFVVGLGYQDSTGFSVGWRYNGGLNNVFRRVDIDGSSQVQLRNSSVEFYLAYLFTRVR
ncbi:Outer membrane protein beta-barrel domain-containing protein [Hymenobacter gelipurpurascens]|uniref:Outer membrane protein beta-barrel domain-containing protein n=1 Tax=Hymenobacter gelipurpurascens TaxID=89968 RepID=A0A212UGX5_9BACT|nr:porin family protein [Hymenobacter gelipurpurascens]SNC77497.1 Outer membrane protein beta-barrel domain-containing protein [Hymenobacter gelipurpurascens]